MKQEHIEAIMAYMRNHNDPDVVAKAEQAKEVMNKELTLTDIYGNSIEKDLWITYPVRDSTSAYFAHGRVYAIELKNVPPRHPHDPGHAEVVLKLVKTSGKKTQICRLLARTDDTSTVTAIRDVIVAPRTWISTK